MKSTTFTSKVNDQKVEFTAEVTFRNFLPTTSYGHYKLTGELEVSYAGHKRSKHVTLVTTNAPLYDEYRGLDDGFNNERVKELHGDFEDMLINEHVQPFATAYDLAAEIAEYLEE